MCHSGSSHLGKGFLSLASSEMAGLESDPVFMS